jgi:antitoxin MazE
MKVTIQKWGNSLGIRIPGTIAKELLLHPGTIVEITLEDKHISIYPPKTSLADMLSKITEENRYPLEWDDNDTQGVEEW